MTIAADPHLSFALLAVAATPDIEAPFRGLIGHTRASRHYSDTAVMRALETAAGFGVRLYVVSDATTPNLYFAAPSKPPPLLLHALSLCSWRIAEGLAALGY